MKVARSDFGFALASDGLVHAIGGNSATGQLTTLEAYDAVTNVWRLEENSLIQSRALFASVEALDGNDYLLGGAHGSTPDPLVEKARSPQQASHSVDYYLHGFDEPTINGMYAMDQQTPLSLNPPITINLLSGANFALFPAVTGTIEAGGGATIFIPTAIGVNLLASFTLYTSDLDGGSTAELGSTTVILGASGAIGIPISTPVTLNNKVLVLRISTVLGLDINLSQSHVYLEISGLNGRP